MTCDLQSDSTITPPSTSRPTRRSLTVNRWWCKECFKPFCSGLLSSCYKSNCENVLRALMYLVKCVTMLPSLFTITDDDIEPCFWLFALLTAVWQDHEWISPRHQLEPLPFLPERSDDLLGCCWSLLLTFKLERHGTYSANLIYFLLNYSTKAGLE